MEKLHAGEKKMYSVHIYYICISKFITTQCNWFVLSLVVNIDIRLIISDPIPVSKSLLNCRCGWFGNGSYKTKDCDCNVTNNVFCATEGVFIYDMDEMWFLGWKWTDEVSWRFN